MKALASVVAVAVAVAAKAKAKASASAELSPACGARAHLSLLVQRNVAQRKHTLPPRPRRYAARVHSASGIFRHDIPVVAKNDVLPCTSPFGFFPLAPSLRKGPDRSKAGTKARATATAKATPPQPSPALCAREGAKQLYAGVGAKQRYARFARSQRITVSTTPSFCGTSKASARAKPSALRMNA